MGRILRLGGLALGGFAAAYVAFAYGPVLYKLACGPVRFSGSKAAPPAMVWIPGGTFWRGSDNPKMRDAQPAHPVTVDRFLMDATAVTNERFTQFVEATGYVTVAERTPQAKDFPGAPPEKLVAGAVVFTPTSGPVPLTNH